MKRNQPIVVPTGTFNEPSPRILHSVFVDRDGVLNEKMPEGCYITCWSEFKLLPGVTEAIGRLNHAGLRVIVVSNQRGIALGLYTAEDVCAIQTEFQNMLEQSRAHIDGFYFCPHDKGQCNCRKPLPGLFEMAVADFPGITGESSVLIGDSLSDIEFGKNLGMLTVYVEGHNERRSESELAREQAELCFSSLADTVDALLAQHLATPQ